MNSKRYCVPDIQHMRDGIQDWLEFGSEQSFIVRIEAMSKAFGLSDRMLIGYLYLSPYQSVSLGRWLTNELWDWSMQHTDLSHNNPEYEETYFARMRIE